ncbi:phytoene/squalene synthase family protein [uncultured Microscilla sp.]|uniref:phytoene/squalene synthase family protein n=1 Tax=uncultured Microscilla sp. TaxID=432653 RepID=UPI002617C33E|nr:phytoene/squalene synthase family protein [uncultured Microscilla sp.]
MKSLYDKVSYKCSKLVTNNYSTSFSLGISFLSQKIRKPVYAIYGFVRFADEIVDTFHGYDKKDLLDRFKQETYQAIDEKISLNPILNSFQQTVNEFNIERELIDTFLKSMEMDLVGISYDQEGYEEYILGSAEVVGLMCLRVFCEGDSAKYDSLKYGAMRLGSAFQKINFLRDLKQDYKELGRTYFPGVDISEFGEINKKEIEEDIEQDFRDGYEGIKGLPKHARFGVYMAYVYYYSLFKKIQNTPPRQIMSARIRISNRRKYMLFFSSYVKHSLNMI